MNNQIKFVRKLNPVCILLVITCLLILITGTVNARSLYVLSDIYQDPQPVKVYDIGIDGSLTLQGEYFIPYWGGGGYRLAVDSDTGYMFVSYKVFSGITLVEAKSMGYHKFPRYMTGIGNPAGIVYSHDKGLLYSVNKGSNTLYAYDWNFNAKELTPKTDNPFVLRYATAYDIALDEIHNLLYVVNGTKKVYVYNTADWSLERTITLGRVAECVAVDTGNGYLYTGGGSSGNQYLTQYHLVTNTILETMVETTTGSGVKDIALDSSSGFVYMTTGNNQASGGGNIRVYNKLLHPIDVVYNVGNPTGLIIPGKEIGYNPLDLNKSIIKILNGDDLTVSNSAEAGDYVTYKICFSNTQNDYTVTDVTVVDHLSDEVTFVSASDELFGEYNAFNHTYTWLYPSLVKGSSACVEITVKINDNIPPRTSIKNYVTANSNTTPQSTTQAELITASNPLNIKKSVLGIPDDQVKWTDVNEVITYNIHFDNNDNDFTVTNISITDNLPDELVFVEADNKTIPGSYDPNKHTYKWTLTSLDPNESKDVFITAKLMDDVTEGIIVTNTVTVKTDETAPSESSVDIKVGEGPLEASQVQIIPSSVRRNGALSGIMAIVEMPEGYKIASVKNVPLMLSFPSDTMGRVIQANNGQLVLESRGRIYVVAVFNKDLVMDAVDGYGPKDVYIEGILSNGGPFAGYSTIDITRFAGN